MKTLTSFILILICSYQFLEAQQLDDANGDAIIYESWDKVSMPFSKSATLNGVDPGDSIEGDYIVDMEFYDNGSKILIANQQSQNVSIIDWASRTPIGNIDLQGFPYDIEVIADKALVSLPFSDETLILDLNGDSVLARIPTPTEPYNISIDEANNRALVSSNSQECHVIDLDSLNITHSIDSFYTDLQSFSFITSNNRNTFNFIDFAINNTGTKAITYAPFTGDGIAIHDINSGIIDTVFSNINPYSIEVAGNRTVFVLDNSPTPKVYRINLNSFQIDSVVMTGYSINSLSKNFSVNSNGEFAIISASGGSGLIKADFTTGSTTSIAPNNAFWMKTSADGSYAVCGGFYTQIIDLSTGTIAATFQGLSQSIGAVADSGYHFIGIDPLRKEYLHAFEYTSNSLTLLGDFNSGSDREADAPYRVDVSADGSRVIVSNQLSKSASILNADSLRLESLVSGLSTGSFGCAMTSDGKYGVFADYEGFAVHVVHLESGQIVASPSVGDRPSIIRIAPGDSLALVTNTRANSVSFVKLDSAMSSNIANLPVGVIGVSWTNQGIFSHLQIMPAGDYALLAASFDDQVQVIDIAQRTIATSLNVGDFPTQIAISPQNSFAAVLNKNENTFSLLNINGVFSSVLNTYITNDNPTRITYDDGEDEFIITCLGDRRVQFFDGITGQLKSTTNFSSTLSPIQTAVLPSGRIAYLLSQSQTGSPNVLRVDGTDYPLPSSTFPCYMDVSEDEEVIAIAISGPDYVGIFKDDTLFTHNHKYEFNTKINVFPNPVSDRINVQLEEEVSNCSIRILTLNGKEILNSKIHNQKEFQVPIPKELKGLYLIDIQSEKGGVCHKIMIE